MEIAKGEATPTTRKQLKSVISTTPAPDGVSGNPDAKSGIMVRKTASVALSIRPKPKTRKKIQSVSRTQIPIVSTAIGMVSLGRGHMPA